MPRSTILSTVFHHGYPIHHVEENGRRFYAASVPDLSGWSMRQEFCSLVEAGDYIVRKLDFNRNASRSPKGSPTAPVSGAQDGG